MTMARTVAIMAMSKEEREKGKSSLRLPIEDDRIV